LLKIAGNSILGFMRLPANYFLPTRASDLEETPVFNVVIAYEDFDTGRNARRTYDFLAEQLGRDCEFATQMWKFDVLGIPRLREMAAKDAGSADIIIVAFHGGKSLADEVKAWLQSWAGSDHHPLALVALYDNSPGDANESARNRDYLATLAARTGMEFFSQAETASKTSGGSEVLPGESAITPWSIRSATQTANPRWGINE
jgi:hypothetical protein